MKLPQCFHKKLIAGICSWAQKWYLEDQDLEIKTESQSIESESQGIRLSGLQKSLQARVYHSFILACHLISSYTGWQE